MSTEQNYVGGGSYATPNPPTAQNAALPIQSPDQRIKRPVVISLPIRLQRESDNDLSDLELLYYDLLRLRDQQLVSAFKFYENGDDDGASESMAIFDQYETILIAAFAQLVEYLQIPKDNLSPDVLRERRIQRFREQHRNQKGGQSNE